MHWNTEPQTVVLHGASVGLRAAPCQETGYEDDASLLSQLTGAQALQERSGFMLASHYVYDYNKLVIARLALALETRVVDALLGTNLDLVMGGQQDLSQLPVVVSPRLPSLRWVEEYATTGHGSDGLYLSTVHPPTVAP